MLRIDLKNLFLHSLDQNKFRLDYLNIGSISAEFMQKENKL
jgi:hypothetical protein